MTNPVENGSDVLEITESENGDSTSSELERLNENISPTPSRGETPPEKGIARTRRQEEKILRTIEQTKALGANTLDLSNHGLLVVPSELLELTNLEHLYLEGNQLTGIPDDFFDCLPNLKWLDLRHNYLIRLPSVFTGRHQNLRNLLLEGNNLRTLPLELGMIKTLHGLNITNNPLEFPPATVIEKGTVEILKFLREMMAAKNSGRLLTGRGSFLRGSGVKKTVSFHTELKDHYTLPQLRSTISKMTVSAGGRIGLKRTGNVKFRSAGLPSPQTVYHGPKPSSFESLSSDQHPDRARTALRRTASLQQFSTGLSFTLHTQPEEVEVEVQHPERVKTGLRRSVSYPLKSDILSSQMISTKLEFSPGDQDEEIKDNLSHDEDGNGSSSSSDEWSDDGGDLKEYAYRHVQLRSMSTEEANKMSALARAELVGPVNKSAELHTQLSYTERKQAKTAKIRKAGAMGTVERKKSLSNSSIFSWKVNQFPEPPSPEYALLKLKEEQKLAKEREFKEKTDAILQRRKDENILKEWRDESKRMQRKKAFEILKKGTKEYPDTATEAPFGIDEDHLQMPSNTERIKHDIKTAHEKLRRTLSPSSRQKIEEEKAARIRELEKRIKQHTTQMHERRKLPKGTPQEEMEAARRELEVAEALHQELTSKRKTLEYRFKAFIGDIPTTSYHSKATANHQ